MRIYRLLRANQSCMLGAGVTLITRPLEKRSALFKAKPKRAPIGTLEKGSSARRAHHCFPYCHSAAGVSYERMSLSSSDELFASWEMQNKPFLFQRLRTSVGISCKHRRLICRLFFP